LRLTIIATRNFFPTNLHLPKTLLSTLVLSPPLGWWDISAKSTQTASYLKKGFFEKGLEVILGSSGRRVRILGVCGLGRNYVMMKVIEVGGIFGGRSFKPENCPQFSSPLSLDRHSSLDCLAAVQASPWIDAGFCG